MIELIPRNGWLGPGQTNRGWLPKGYPIKWKQLSDFDKLYNQATVVGSSALPLTCDRDDPRKSIIDGTDVAADVADLRLVNGIFVSSSLKSEILLVDNDLTNAAAWVPSSAKAVITEPESEVYRISFDGTGAVSINANIASAARDGFTRFEVRLISGSFTGGDTNDFIGFRETNTLRGTQFALANAVSGWAVGDATVTSADTTNRVTIRSTNASAAEIEIRNIRPVDSTAPAAGFPDDSPANTDYAKDILTFLHTFTATATMQFTVTPYGWGADENPVDAEAVLFESGAFRLKLTAAGLIEIDGTCVSTKKLTANTLSVVTVKYDGVNHTLQVDGETPVVVASSIIPSGTSYVGDNAAGTKTAHVVEHIAIYDNELFTAEEITVGEDGYQARLGGLVLR